MPQNYKNRPVAGGSAPRPQSVTCLSCISWFSTGLNQAIFAQTKQKNFCSSRVSRSKIVVVFLVAFTAADRFFKRVYGPQMKQTKKCSRPFFQTWRIICSLTIFFFWCKSSVYSYFSAPSLSAGASSLRLLWRRH